MVIFYQNKPCQKLLFQGEEMKRGGWIKQQRKKTMRSKKIELEDVTTVHVDRLPEFTAVYGLRLERNMLQVW